MSQSEICRFMRNLQGKVVSTYGVSNEVASDAVTKSIISKLIVASPDFVTHYSLNNWAEDVWNEYRGLPVEV